MDNTSAIMNAFNDEGLKIVDPEQIKELQRWKLDDFDSLTHFAGDNHVSSSPVISVCGSGRSGTTLTRVILDTHPQIYSGPESYLFLPVPIDIPSLADKFQLDASILNKVKTMSSSRSEFIETTSEMILNHHKKSVWVDKTSRNIHTASYFFTHFPEGKMINVVRDPRDVIASLRTHRKRKLVDGQLINTGYTMPLQLCISRWLLAAQNIFPYREKLNYMEIKYEDLIQTTELTIKKICAFCEVQYESSMMQFFEVSSSTRDATKFIQNVEATYPIFPSSIGRYQRDLDSSQIEEIVAETSKIAKHFGYNL